MSGVIKHGMILACLVCRAPDPLLAQAPIEGTVMVKSNFGKRYVGPPQPLAVLDGNLIFLNYTQGSGWELWRTDGSPWSATRIKEIHPGPASFDGHPAAPNGKPISFIEMNENLFFVVDDGVNGMEIWKTDGTEAGTVQVKDHPSGPQDFDPVLLQMDGLFYYLRHGENGAELWKSDGTEAGTILVRVFPSHDIWHLRRVEEMVYFCVGRDDRKELWRSDGTKDGTHRLSSGHHVDSWSVVGGGGKIFFTDRGTGGPSVRIWTSDGTLTGKKLLKTTDSGYYYDYFFWKGVLFFTADHRLWTSDGTETGTRPFGHGRALEVADRFEHNGMLYLSILGTSARELWRTDGTATGSVLLHKFPRNNPYGSVGIYGLSEVNGALYFIAYDEAGGYEPWRSDGTPEGTFRLKDLHPGPGSSFPSPPQLVNGVPYLLVRDDSNHAHLWRTDGTEAGTTLVKELYAPAVTVDWYNQADWLGSTSTKAFFLSQRPQNKLDLWVTDGSAGGTLRVAQFSQEPTSLLAILGERAILSVPRPTGGTDLWSTDGTPEELVPLGRTLGPNYSHLGGGDLLRATEFNGMLFFRTTEEEGISHLWKSDGTDAGTIPVAEIRPSYSYLGPDMAHANGVLFLSASDDDSGSSLWKTDGTAMGTIQVKAFDRPLGQLVAMQNAVFFLVEGDQHNQLWKSDGTEAGTVLVKLLPQGLIYLRPQGSSLLLFVSHALNNRWALWRSDGTEAGTVFVKAIGRGHAWTAEVNGMVLFIADQGLWRTDGTAEGTLEVKRFDQWPQTLVSAGKVAFLQVDDQLWRSDGSKSGTVLFKQITNFYAHSLTPVDDMVYFWTYTWESDGENERQRHDLWKSDGTEAGTVLVRENLPSPVAGKFYVVHAAAHGILYFLAFPDQNVGEVWRSDGTAEGTYRLPTLGNTSFRFPRDDYGVVTRLVQAGDTLFFMADDGIHGCALWKVIRDSDGDGLSDDWEKEHFDGAAVANDDPDADGMTNWQESRAGTNPKDSSSLLQFTRVTPLTNSKVWLEWRSVPNQEYVLLRAPSLPASPDNLTIVERHIPATPPVNSFADTSATGPGPHFYLLGVEGTASP